MKIAVIDYITLCSLVEAEYMFVFRCVSRERKKRLLASTCLFVRLHAWNKSAVTGRVFVTLIQGFHENLEVTIVTKVTKVRVLAMVTPKCQQYLSIRLFLPSSALTRPQHSLFSDIVLSYY